MYTSPSPCRSEDDPSSATGWIARDAADARIAAAEKDAERYRWLKENVRAEFARKPTEDFVDYNMHWQINPYLVAVTAVASEVSFDEAIDAAILKEKEA